MMRPALLGLVLLSTSAFAEPPQTDPYGPLLFREEALLIRSRFLTPDKPKAVPSAERLETLVCERLFPDCATAFDEFAKRRAVEAHHAELESLASVLREAPSFVVAGTACFGPYDFKQKRLPITSVGVLAPGRTGAAYQEYEQPLAFKLSRTWSSLAVDPELAERLVTQFAGVRCAELRIEVTPPPKPVRWRVVPGPWSEFDFEPAVVPVTVKRARVLAANGSTLATLP